LQEAYPHHQSTEEKPHERKINRKKRRKRMKLWCRRKKRGNLKTISENRLD